jgi:hypothetical protein
VFLEPPGILESPFQVGLGLVTLRFAPEVVVGAAEADQRLGVRGIEVETCSKAAAADAASKAAAWSRARSSRAATASSVFATASCRRSNQ